MQGNERTLDGGRTVNSLQEMARQIVAEQTGGFARDTYIAQKMPDLPVTYQQLMPATSDRAVLAQSEQRIRRQYREDMRREVPRHVARGTFLGAESSPEALAFHQKAGEARQAMEAGDLPRAHQILGELAAMNAPGGAPAPAPVDVSKMTANEMIAYGLSLEQMPRRIGQGPVPGER